VIRGSSSHTGARALRDYYEALARGGISPAITPDGPRGPPWKFKPGAILLAQMPPRTRNRKSLVIQQPLNPQHHLHIFLTVKPVPARTLYRLQHGKLRLPIPQNKRLQSRQPANLANPIKILLNGCLCRGRGARHIQFQSEGDAAIVAVCSEIL